jgi:hypothetical protein
VERHSEIVVQTPASRAERRRNLIRFAGIVLSVTGLVLMRFHVAFLALIPLGVVAAAAGPAQVRQRVLFRLLSEPEGCLITPLANVMTHSIVRIEGRYETSGWDGRTSITAVLSNEEACPLLEISGTDEALARAACEQLASLCRCAAEYTGPFGDVARFGIQRA